MRPNILILDTSALERARIAKGLFRVEVAAQAGVSKASAHRAFTRGDVGLRVARSIARVLGLDLASILIPSTKEKG